MAPVPGVAARLSDIAPRDRRSSSLSAPVAGTPSWSPGAASPIGTSAGAVSPSSVRLIPLVLKSFTGRSDDFSVIPPDTMGAVGPAHVVSLYNSGFLIQDKATGAIRESSRISLRSFWSSVLLPQTGEPPQSPASSKILYDRYEGRFVAVSLEGATDPVRSTLLLAISATSDPAGVWYQWAIAQGSPGDGSQGSPADNSYANYPALGLDGENIYLTANIFNPSGFTGARILVISKPDLSSAPPPPPLSGLWIDDPTGLGSSGEGFSIQPVHAVDNANDPATKAPYFVFSSSFVGDITPGVEAGRFRRRLLGILSLTDQDDDGSYDSIGLGYQEVPGYSDVFPVGSDNVPQLEGSMGIDWGGTRLQNAFFRDGFVYTTHTTPHYDLPAGWDNISQQVFHADVSWYRVDPANVSDNLSVILDNTTPHPFLPAEAYRVQDPSGALDNTRLSFCYPSLAVNRRGDVALGFSGSSGTTFVSAYATGRRVGDRQMLGIARLKAGLGPYVRKDEDDVNRWGDYSATCVDPDDNTASPFYDRFWTVQEYAEDPGTTSGTFGTWWALLDVGNVSDNPNPGGGGIFGTGGGSGGGCSTVPGSGDGVSVLVTVGAAAAAAILIRRKRRKA